MIGFAIVFGLLAVFIAQIWLNNQADRQAKSMHANKNSVATETIVVAAKPLRFGTVLDDSVLKEVPWPEQTVPAGAFHKIGDVLSSGRRVVLDAIEANEPVLAVKITGAGERATLSALVHKGMKAATIRVNDIDGVGGFVLPGDRVDVVMTRKIGKSSAATQVVVQNARVLAVDQTADDRTSKATIAKSVTLEVNTVEAQKVWLAYSVGKLSLLLHKAGETAHDRTRKITLSDLGSNEQVSERKAATTTMVVTRPKGKQDYTVPIEGSDAMAKVEREELAR